MVRTTGLFALAVMAVGISIPANSEQLQPATIEAWQEYLRGAGVRMQTRVEGRKPFLWMEDEAGRMLRVRRGEVLVAPLVGHGTEAVPNGLIHDWIGAVFIPDATIESLLSVVHDYDRYKEIFKPVVAESQSLNAAETEQEFSMVWRRHVLFVDAAMQGRYRAHDVMIDSHRGYSIVDTTTIQEIENYGRAGKHLLPPDTGGGFLWRIYSLSRYEERDGGVYLEIEAIALSRDVPSSLRWLVNPVVNHLSVNSLTTTLRQTRKAVDGQGISQARLVTTESKRMK